jgi:hypothetical protein
VRSHDLCHRIHQSRAVTSDDRHYQQGFHAACLTRSARAWQAGKRKNRQPPTKRLPPRAVAL